MLNTILILLILHTLYNIIFKPKINVLACGLFGYCGSKPPNIEKIKILGLYNVSRGSHSCGILIDNVLTKGVDKQKVFDDFISENILTPPVDNYTIIGHTRYATIGAHSEANAHPFMINDHFVGAHNGGIKNISELCFKYKIPHVFSTVDSLHLYKIIESTGTSVLSEYTGKAALLWTDLNEPNTLYAFHGASKETKDGKTYEERPLFMLKTEEGVYFSSMEESLNAIKESEDQIPEILEYNTVLKFQNGEIIGEGIVIDRELTNVPPPVTAPVKNIYQHGSNTNSRVSTQFRKLDNVPEENLIEREVRPARASDGKIISDFVYFFRGRFFNKNHTLAHGRRRLADRGIVVSEHDASGKDFYFYCGAMLKSLNDFNMIELQKKNDPKSYLNNVNTDNFAYHLSKHTAHPITNMPNIEGKDLEMGFRIAWYQNGKRCVDSFTPKFSGRHYIINNFGFLTNIKSTIPNEVTLEPKAISSQTTFDFDRTKLIQENHSCKLLNAPCNNTSSVVFSVAYGTNEEAYKALGRTGFQALMAYVKDYFDSEYEADLKTEDYTKECIRIIEESVSTGTCIKDNLAGPVHRIHDYYDFQVEKEVTSGTEDDSSPFTDSYHVDALETLHAIENPEEIDIIEEVEDDEQLVECANAKLEDLVEYLVKIDDVADRLQANDSDFAQELASVIYKQVVVMKHALIDKLQTYDHSKNIIKLINTKVKNDTV